MNCFGKSSRAATAIALLTQDPRLPKRAFLLLVLFLWRLAHSYRIKNTIESFYERWYATWALAISEDGGERTTSLIYEHTN